jgi:hypothetical protein
MATIKISRRNYGAWGEDILRVPPATRFGFGSTICLSSPGPRWKANSGLLNQGTDPQNALPQPPGQRVFSLSARGHRIDRHRPGHGQLSACPRPQIFWNRYPGARFDSESWTYGYSFSKELLEEWHWAEHFSPQPETERYLNYVAEKFDLRRDIQCASRVSAAYYQEETRSWHVMLEDGRRYSRRLLVTAIGVLSAPTLPRIPGVETIKGQSCHTANWPKEPVNLAGKRVGIIGTGAAAVQTIQTIAKDVGHLTVFQRTAWLLHPQPRSALRPRGHARGTRGFLGEALCRARFRHLARQFPRHPGRPRGQRADL